MVKAALSVLVPLLLAADVAAFGCHSISYTTCQDRIVHWYDPDDGQICDPHDCGGGRAPPRRDVPGCAFYTGTETLKTEPSYLPCWKPSTALAVPTGSSAILSSVESTPTNTGEVASLRETMTSSSVRASTTVSVVPSTTSSSATGSDASAAASPSTTLPATMSTTALGGMSTSRNGTSSAAAATPTHTGDAGKVCGASTTALVAGIVCGFALLSWV